MTATLLIDLALAGLLVATIVYAAMLNRRLAVLRDGKEELTKVVEQLGHATVNAGAAIEQLKRTAAESGTALQATVAGANAATDELRFLVERGERAADRVEAAVRAARQPEPVRTPSLHAIRDAEPSLPMAAMAGESRTRQSLLQAIEKMR